MYQFGHLPEPSHCRLRTRHRQYALQHIFGLTFNAFFSSLCHTTHPMKAERRAFSLLEVLKLQCLEDGGSLAKMIYIKRHSTSSCRAPLNLKRVSDTPFFRLCVYFLFRCSSCSASKSVYIYTPHPHTHTYIYIYIYI